MISNQHYEEQFTVNWKGLPLPSLYAMCSQMKFQSSVVTTIKLNQNGGHSVCQLVPRIYALSLAALSYLTSVDFPKCVLRRVQLILCLLYLHEQWESYAARPTCPSRLESARLRNPSQILIMTSCVSVFLASPGFQPRRLQIFCANISLKSSNYAKQNRNYLIQLVE